MKYLSSKEVSDILSINISTLKRWTESGKLSCEKTAGGHRKFTMQHVRDFYKSNTDAVKSVTLRLENKNHKFLYGLINDQKYKDLAINLANASLDADEDSISIIINGLYMNATPIADLLDYVIDVAGHIVEDKLSANKITHPDAYLSRNLITRTVDTLNRDKPNGSFNGKNALCINFEDNLPDIGVVMSEVLLRDKGYNVFNTGSHAELGSLHSIIEERKIEVLLFYLCDMQCCNAVAINNIKKTRNQVRQAIKLADKLNISIFFGGEGLDLLGSLKESISGSFLTYNDLLKLI